MRLQSACLRDWMAKARRTVAITLTLCVSILTVVPVGYGIFARVSAARGLQWDNASSRRVSTCGYVIAFASNSDELTASSRMVIAEAAHEASRNSSHLITVAAYWASGELPEMASRRREVVKNELDRVKSPNDRVWLNTMAHDTPTEAEAYVTVCGPVSDVEMPPAPQDPDRLVSLRIGPTDLAIPLRYLGPSYWRDTPLETMNLGGMMTIWLGWPGLQDWTSDTLRRCLEEQMQRGLYCDERLLIYLQAPNSFLEGPRQPPSSQPAEYIPIEGLVFGASFFVHRQGAKTVGYLEAKGDDGRTVLGWCSWGRLGPDERVPTAGQAAAALGAGNGALCRLTNIPIGAGLLGTIVLSGKNFHDWRAIHAGVAQLVTRFEQQAR
jgi:hypothetical protein